MLIMIHMSFIKIYQKPSETYICGLFLFLNSLLLNIFSTFYQRKNTEGKTTVHKDILGCQKSKIYKKTDMEQDNNVTS